MNDRLPASPLVIAAPSGAGKTSLAQALVGRQPLASFSVSATTRRSRPGERNGIDYIFVDDDGFDAMIETGQLVEWAQVHGNRYGTPRSSIEAATQGGRRVVLDIDVQGARQVRQVFPDAVLVFVLPPSAAELNQRLSKRGSEGDAERRRRLKNALRELDAAAEFDHVVVNDDFERALGAIETIFLGRPDAAAEAPDLESRVRVLKHDIQDLLKEGVAP